MVHCTRSISILNGMSLMKMIYVVYPYKVKFSIYNNFISVMSKIRVAVDTGA